MKKLEKQIKKVIVLGKGELCLKICNWFNTHPDYNLQLVVPVIPEPKWTDSLISWCNENEIVYLESGNNKDISDEILLAADLVMSVFYSKIIKSSFIDKCNKIINLHNAPLPKYRGVSPINWALKNEEKEHGVTIHEISPGIDDGNIIGQIKYSIYPEFEEVIDVYNKAILYGYILFQNTIPILDFITPKKQDESKISYYSKKENHLLEERSNFTKEQSM
jgi:methionyl-tRNA formyltransferase